MKTKIHKKKHLRKIKELILLLDKSHVVNNIEIYLDVKKLDLWTKKSVDNFYDKSKTYSIRKENINVKNRALLLSKIITLAIELKYDNNKLIELYKQTIKS